LTRSCRYLDGEIGSEAAVARLRDEALVPNATQLLAVIERQRTRVLAYPLGRRLVLQSLLDAPAAQRWSRLAAIATTLTIDRATASPAAASTSS
jgi:hypothetical protein